MNLLTEEEFISITENLIDPNFPKEQLEELYDDLLSRPNFANMVLYFSIKQETYPKNNTGNQKVIIDSCFKRLFIPEYHKKIFKDNQDFILQSDFLNLALEYIEKSYTRLGKMTSKLLFITENNFEVFLPLLNKLEASDNILDKYKLLFFKYLYFIVSPNQESYSDFFILLQQLTTEDLFTDTTQNYFRIRVLIKIFRKVENPSKTQFIFMLSKEQSIIEYILVMISQLITIENPTDLNINLIFSFVKSLCNLISCFKKHNESEDDFNEFLQELIEPFINILNYLINTDFLKGSNAIELIISNITSHILDVMDMETYLPHLFPIIENCCKIPELSDEDPIIFISSLYDELNLNNYLKDDDLRLNSSKLFNKIIEMNPDSKSIIFNEIFHDGQDINPENSYLFTYYIQYLISSGTKLSDDDISILTATYDAILDAPADENDVFMILAKICLLTVSPYIDREQFTEDVVQNHLEIIQNSIETFLTEKSLDIDLIPKLSLIEVIPTFSLCVFTLYLRYIRNSVQCGFETFINEKVLEFITKYKSISILDSDSLAYSAIAKKIPDEATKYLESILVPLYDSILLMLDDEDISDKEYEIDASIEQKCHQISDILLSVGKLIDFRPMLEKHIEIIEKLVDNDLETIDFVKSLNPLIDFENHLQMMIEYTMRLSDIRNLSICCIYEVLLPISYSICKYPNVFFSPNENGQTLAEIFVSFFLEKLCNEKQKTFEIDGKIFLIKGQFNLYDTDYFPFMVIFALVITNKVNFDISPIINYCIEKIKEESNQHDAIVNRCLAIPILALLSVSDVNIPEDICVLIYQLFQVYFENKNALPFDQEDTIIGKKFVSEGFAKLAQLFEVERENLMKISNIFSE